MAIGLSGFACQARAPRGNLIRCSYAMTGSAGAGKDYCEVTALPDETPRIDVVLHKGNYYGMMEFHMSYPADPGVFSYLQDWAIKNKIHKLNGYQKQDPVPGSTRYSVCLEYDSGDSISFGWYGHDPKKQALDAFQFVKEAFAPWRTQAEDAAEPVVECAIGTLSTATRASDSCQLLCKPGTVPTVEISLNAGNIHGEKEYHGQYEIDEESVLQLQKDLARMGVGSMESGRHDALIEGGSRSWVTLTFLSGRKLSLSWHPGPSALYSVLNDFFGPWKAQARKEE